MLKPSILVIYYSQTQQLKLILDKIVEHISTQCHIDFVPIEPLKKFEFPWKSTPFFDCMPESVLQIPEEINPLSIPKKNYDLVLLGLQPWFLSPSIPINSFLKSEYAQCLKNKKIITVIGCRNMWLNAQEKVKEELMRLNSQLVGNIVLVDKNPNLISVLTVIRWSFKGIKEKTKWLPAAGVQEADINACTRFGPIILNAINNEQLETVQDALLQANAIDLKPSLVLLEKNGITNFRKFAAYIYQKGERGNPNRIPRVVLFKRLLMVGIFILSPITQLKVRILTLLHKKRLNQSVHYFKNILLKKNVF